MARKRSKRKSRATTPRSSNERDTDGEGSPVGGREPEDRRSSARLREQRNRSQEREQSQDRGRSPAPVASPTPSEVDRRGRQENNREDSGGSNRSRSARSRSGEGRRSMSRGPLYGREQPHAQASFGSTRWRGDENRGLGAAVDWRDQRYALQLTVIIDERDLQQGPLARHAWSEPVIRDLIHEDFDVQAVHLVSENLAYLDPVPTHGGNGLSWEEANELSRMCTRRRGWVGRTVYQMLEPVLYQNSPFQWLKRGIATRDQVSSHGRSPQPRGQTGRSPSG